MNSHVFKRFLVLPNGSVSDLLNSHVLMHVIMGRYNTGRRA